MYDDIYGNGNSLIVISFRDFISMIVRDVVSLTHHGCSAFHPMKV